ncbi:Triosephosphate isomerase, cytosolic [Camellia lanceoleosa]|uniref:Triosephosphate isomerase, cytosolic n=1 Tax=Camellia lanceoleosa TaxID=1840588 RepID=A0ACC0H4K4_9ERIC|nr:Triosephosphate isomerase, cytosolic [Camellia lanceoleosa]
MARSGGGDRVGFGEEIRGGGGDHVNCSLEKQRTNSLGIYDGLQSWRNISLYIFPIGKKGLRQVVVSPPYVFLPLVKDLLRPDFHIAAQNCWVKKGGTFTGEVRYEMLVNMGIPWVILGHFERRALLNESNKFVGDKVAYALSQGLKVIACIGETRAARIKIYHGCCYCTN